MNPNGKPSSVTTHATRTITIDDVKGIALHPWPMRLVMDDNFRDKSGFVAVEPHGRRMRVECKNGWAEYALESRDASGGVSIWKFLNGDWANPNSI